MPYTLRWAHADDEAIIKALVRSSNINPLGIHWQHFLVAEDGARTFGSGRIVGIGQIKVHGDGSRELASIATVPDRQGEGIATAIINELLAVDEATGTGVLHLTCRAPMEPFYRRFGFRPVEHPAEMPAYFRRLMRAARVFYAVGRLFGNRDTGLVMVRKGE